MSTPQTDTPEDAECGAPDDATWPGAYVSSDFARTLERQRDEAREQVAAMREAIRDSDASLRKCLNYMLRLPLSGSDAECEAVDDAHHALAKLQPFLKS
jgi:hypothetical protein